MRKVFTTVVRHCVLASMLSFAVKPCTKSTATDGTSTNVQRCAPVALKPTLYEQADSNGILSHRRNTPHARKFQIRPHTPRTILCSDHASKPDGDGDASKDAVTAEQQFESVMKDAQRCSDASQVVILIIAYLARPDLPAELRLAAENLQREWQEKADKNFINVQGEWITKQENEKREATQRKKLSFAYDLIRLQRLSMAIQELDRCSKNFPDFAEPDFLLGVISHYVEKDSLKAMKHFRKAAERDPRDFRAWNNAALCGYHAGRTLQIGRDFDKAIKAAAVNARDVQSVVDNLGRVLAEGTLNSHHIIQLKNLYEASISGDIAKPFSAYRFPDETDDDYATRVAPRLFLPKDWKSDAPVEWRIKEEQISRSSGSGFVIADKYILTNHHVVSNSKAILIRDPNTKPIDNAAVGSADKMLNATIFAEDKETDLALLHCPELDCEDGKSRPAVLCTTNPDPGAEIMTLGFPRGRDLGTGLKSAIGSIMSIDAVPGMGDLIIFDANMTNGNSGGPIIDLAGCVSGVNIAGMNLPNEQTGTVDQYKFAIPIRSVWTFLKDKCPDLVTVQAKSNKEDFKKWPDARAQVEKSVVFIETLVTSD
jgi:S1-C subfamily serine protease